MFLTKPAAEDGRNFYAHKGDDGRAFYAHKGDDGRAFYAHKGDEGRAFYAHRKEDSKPKMMARAAVGGGAGRVSRAAIAAAAKAQNEAAKEIAKNQAVRGHPRGGLRDRAPPRHRRRDGRRRAGRRRNRNAGRDLWREYELKRRWNIRNKRPENKGIPKKYQRNDMISVRGKLVRRKMNRLAPFKNGTLRSLNVHAHGQNDLDLKKLKARHEAIETQRKADNSKAAKLITQLELCVEEETDDGRKACTQKLMKSKLFQKFGKKIEA